jgi:hypothetical protein
MAQSQQLAFEPRKTPVQARLTVTVEAMPRPPFRFC